MESENGNGERTFNRRVLELLLPGIRERAQTEDRPEVVVITGASAGIGRATAREFAKRGARIGLIARGVDGLEAAKKEVEYLGGEAIVITADVADAQAIDDAAERVERELGPIDIWINNAMTAVLAEVKNTTPEEFRRVTEVTYLGAVHGTLAALKRMLPRDRGMIVQVGSALAYRGIPLQATYCAAKHAIQGFTDSLHAELLHDGSRVRMTMVNLPGLNTPQFRWVRSKLPRKSQPVPPIFQPEVAARAIYWCAHHDRREVNVAWPAMKAVWGNNLFPRLGDIYLAKTGFEGQMTDEQEDPDRPDNLYDPLPGDHGAHGVFDERAITDSVNWKMNRNRGWLAAGAAFLLAGIALASTRQSAGRE